jgi:hypothetical protein
MTPIETAVDILTKVEPYVADAYEVPFPHDDAHFHLLESIRAFIKEYKPPTRKFRKLPMEVEAVQFTGENHGAIKDFVGPSRYANTPQIGVSISTLEGNMHVSVGDWVIKGIKGEFWPVKPDIFALTYEAVE